MIGKVCCKSIFIGLYLKMETHIMKLDIKNKCTHDNTLKVWKMTIV